MTGNVNAVSVGASAGIGGAVQYSANANTITTEITQIILNEISCGLPAAGPTLRALR